jgi:protein TonB
MEEYNQRPRKKFIGARVEEYRFAQYVEDWRQKIERIGNLNYPDAAKGKLYGSLVLTVVIKANGDLERVEVNRSSGQSLLDDAARRIVQMAAPYAAFPEAIRRDTDVLEITRTWTFTNADRLRLAESRQ